LAHHIEAKEPIWLVQGCGLVGMIGCAVALIADLLGVRLSDHIGLVSDTISNLAAGGRWDWLMDYGLYAFVLAVLAVALGTSRWRFDSDWQWAAGQVLLIVIAADIFAIAAYEAYSNPQAGPQLHYKFVYLLGIAFPLMAWLTSDGLGSVSGRLRTPLRVFAVGWALAGPVLFVMPTAWDGLYERVLALLMLGWFALVAWLLWQLSRSKV